MGLKKTIGEGRPLSGKPDAKLKLLYLKDLLSAYTDEDHILNAAELADLLLSKYGIECERKSIYKDLTILQQYGCNVIRTKSPKKGFFLAEGEFETAELRLLSDAIQAANFISKKKTITLLKKIESFSSVYRADILREQIYIDSRAKSDNEALYYTIDTIDRAIKAKKKVSLVYVRRRIDDTFAARKESRTFVLSPYAMIWSNDHYYLVANNEKYNNLMNIRIDRIHSAKLLEEPARPIGEVSNYETEFDPADYTSKTFNMFSGEQEMIELKCSNALIEAIIDRFGESAHTRIAGGSCFYLRTEAAVSDGLVSWIMQFGDQIEVVSPVLLREKVAERAEQIYSLYK